MDEFGQNRLRIIDANINRLTEGLRALEDIARFALDHKDLSASLKKLRHDLESNLNKLKPDLLAGRDSQADVGTGNFDSYPIPDMVSFSVANARRAEQSCRVLEDISKLEPRIISPELFKRARFAIYTIEKDLIFALTRRDLRQQVKGLYVIISPDMCLNLSPLEAASQVLKAGVRLIQLREKQKSTRSAMELATNLSDLCHTSEALFIVNDSLELALVSGADGLHLGQDDMPVPVARKHLGPRKLIGVSVSSVEEALDAQHAGADYVAPGAIFETNSKTDITCIGTDILVDICKAVAIPVVAIGGINKHNIKQIIESGAHSAAVISSVLGADTPYESARELIAAINSSTNE